MVNFITLFSTARVLIELFFFILDNAKKQANIYFTFGAGDKCQCNHEYIEHGNTYLPGKNEQVRILRTLYNDRFLFSFLHNSSIFYNYALSAYHECIYTTVK